MTDKYDGNDNYGKPKGDYLAKIAAMDDQQLENETAERIRLSAYASNNWRSDYHWQCDACYDESKRRDPQALIYVRAYQSVKDEVTGD
jgi:hypothetical protein